MKNDDSTDDEATTELHASVMNYGEAELLDGQLKISCACSYFTNRGEDRHAIYFESPQLGESRRGDSIARD